MRVKMREVLSVMIMLLCIVFIACALYIIQDLDNTILAYVPPTAAEQQSAAFAQSREEGETFVRGYAALQFQPYVPVAEREPEESGWLYGYTAPEGFEIVTDSAQWNEGKLAALYNELKRNGMGEEIYALSQIVIHRDADTTYGADGYFTGGYTAGATIDGIGRTGVELPLSFYSGTIHLYQGDRLISVEEYAYTLSYAYGQLYTQYYMFDGPGQDITTSHYAALRGYGDFDPDSEMDETIAARTSFLAGTSAEDYVLLMGSPNAIGIVNYPDVLAQAAGYEVPSGYDFVHTNVQPQSNIDITLAWQVDGLAEYYYGFLEAAPGGPSGVEYNAGITITRVAEEDGSYSYTRPRYEVTWQTPFRNATYTLVRQVEDGYMPVKTVPRGYEATATIGSVQAEDGEWHRDMFLTGNVAFYVIAKLPDGRYIQSEPLTYWFG